MDCVGLSRGSSFGCHINNDLSFQTGFLLHDVLRRTSHAETRLYFCLVCIVCHLFRDRLKTNFIQTTFGLLFTDQISRLRYCQRLHDMQLIKYNLIPYVNLLTYLLTSENWSTNSCNDIEWRETESERLSQFKTASHHMPELRSH